LVAQDKTSRSSAPVSNRATTTARELDYVSEPRSQNFKCPELHGFCMRARFALTKPPTICTSVLLMSGKAHKVKGIHGNRQNPMGGAGGGGGEHKKDLNKAFNERSRAGQGFIFSKSQLRVLSFAARRSFACCLARADTQSLGQHILKNPLIINSIVEKAAVRVLPQSLCLSCSQS
jgi:hypothetical protein